MSVRNALTREVEGNENETAAFLDALRRHNELRLWLEGVERRGGRADVEDVRRALQDLAVIVRALGAYRARLRSERDALRNGER